YMAPEQIVEARAVGPPADVFALGAVLYECLAGEPAFVGDTPLAILTSVTEGKRVPLRSVRPDAPDWLVRAVERALARAPARRFRDGAELARALVPGGRSRAWLALPVVAIAVLSFFLLRRSDRPSPPAAPVAPVESAGVLVERTMQLLPRGQLDEVIRLT